VAKTLSASRFLMDQSIFVMPIRPPTVPAGTARLRVTFSAIHTEGQLVKLLDAMEKLARYLSMEIEP